MFAALAAPAWAAAPALPLQSVSYTVDVTGPLAEVVIRQTYVNASDRFVDATYLFPLDDGAAVDAMVVTVGDRVIRSEIHNREEARALYEAAADDGRIAALTQQERPNVFTQLVANLPPDVPIEVELHVVVPLDRVDGEWQLVVPLVVAPRFVPPGSAGDVGAPYAIPQAAADGLADDGLREGGTGVRASVDVVVHAGMPIFSVSSPSHPVQPAIVWDDATVALDSVPLTRDVVLRWRTSGVAPASAMLVSGNYGMLLVEPPVRSDFAERVPREVVWVIDTSCSMSGAPLELAQEAMSRALRTMDPRDSFALMGFGNNVTTLSAKPVPATLANVTAGLAFVDGLEANGGTYMMQAVEAALDLPLDPSRRRTVVFVTDGQVSNDPELLAKIGQRAADATFVSLGIGGSPNRYLLDEMATLGGGVAAYALLGQDAGLAMSGLVAAMDRPIWTGLQLDWGDCAPRGLAPARLPDLRPGRPLRLLARVDGACDDPIYVTARTGRGTETFRVDPVRVPRGRAMASTWARERVADLERRAQQGGPDPRDAVRELGLSAGIVTSETSFVAVDTERSNPGARGAPVEQALDLPDGEEAQELLVTATQRVVNVSSTSRGQVLSKEFLSRVPVGRDYQSAVQSAIGVQPGSGGNPNMSGAGTDENTYLLDGANLTDPVTGTFSASFNFDAVREIVVTDQGRMPESPGGGAVVEVVPVSGTNDLGFHADVGGLGAGQSLAAGSAGGGLSGPIVRDKLWFATEATGASRAFEGVASEALRLYGRATLQPAPEHRFTLTGTGDPGTLRFDGGTARYGGGLGDARWQWFPGSDTTFELRGNALHRAIGDRSRERLEASTSVRTLGVEDPLDGRHELAAGLSVARIAWDAPGGEVAEPLATGFVQDLWAITRTLRLGGGARLDLRPQARQLLPSPRLFLVWDPTGDGRSRIAGGFGRYVDTNRLLPGFELPIAREVHLALEREVVRDLAISAAATLTRERFPFVASPDLFALPSGPAPEVERQVRSLAFGLRKERSRRWAADAGWTWTPPSGDRGLLRDPRAPWVPGFLGPLREHAVSAAAYWDLPTDPFTLSLGGFGRWASAVAAGPDEPWWVQTSSAVGVSVQQAVEVPKGHLTARVALARTVNELGAALLPLEAFALVPGVAPISAQPALRLDAGLTYGF